MPDKTREQRLEFDSLQRQRTMTTPRPLNSVTPTETLELENGLSLVPRIKLNLTVHSSALTISKPIDEWKIKRALVDFLLNSLSTPITVPEEDLVIKRLRDLKKRKRDEPVASGALVIRDLGFLSGKSNKFLGEEEGVKGFEKKFLDWREYLVEKMDGIELNIEAVKFKLNVAVPASDYFEAMKKEWQEFYAFGNRGYSRGGKQDPDTIVLKNVPSRWFAEPRVSSKPSMLVTHTIFSTFGKISDSPILYNDSAPSVNRNLNVSEDNDLAKAADVDGLDLVSGLYCKVVVQFEKYRDFHDALKVLCSRSLQKQGSKMKADYEVSWDKDGFFRNSKTLAHERTNSIPAIASDQYRSEAPRRQPYISHRSPENIRPRRFKE